MNNDESEKVKDELIKIFDKLVEQKVEVVGRPEDFEKDDDQNQHIDLIHSMANLRSKNYKL